MTEPDLLTHEQLVVESRRFVMQCRGCGQAAVPQVMPGDVVDYVRLFILHHATCVRDRT